jgi:mono/diheme cytochrome c family protein
MPSWYTLTPQDRQALVAYIKLFSPRWKKEHPTPISVPPETAVTAQSVRHGHELFEKMECWKCHGQEGRGDGPSASTLTDSKDRPITPYDFTHGERFKCGETNKDLYTIFMTGVDGTPMPSFSDNLKPEEAWDIVHYLRALQPRKSAAREIAKSIGLKPGPIDQPAGDQPNPPAAAQPSGADSTPQQAAPAAEPSSSAPDNNAQPSAPTTASPEGQQPSNPNSPK